MIDIGIETQDIGVVYRTNKPRFIYSKPEPLFRPDHITLLRRKRPSRWLFLRPSYYDHKFRRNCIL